MTIEPNSIHCADWQDLLGAIAPQSIDLLITDPPYGQTQATWDIAPDWAVWWQAVKRVLKPRGAVVMTAIQPLTSILITSNLSWYREHLVWDKGRGTNFLDANRKHLRCHEDIVVFAQQSPTYNPQMGIGKPYIAKPKGSTALFSPQTIKTATFNDGERYPLSIIKHQNSNSFDPIHPTAKPVPLWEYLIKTFSNAGELVLDPFVGGGTTAAACKNTGRDYIVGDLDPDFIDITRKRVIPTFGMVAKPVHTPRYKDKGFTDLPLFQAPSPSEPTIGDVLSAWGGD